MRTIVLLLALMAAVLAGCQAVPAVRKNNCACVWEALDRTVDGRALA